MLDLKPSTLPNHNQSETQLKRDLDMYRGVFLIIVFISILFLALASIIVSLKLASKSTTVNSNSFNYIAQLPNQADLDDQETSINIQTSASQAPVDSPHLVLKTKLNPSNSSPSLDSLTESVIESMQLTTLAKKLIYGLEKINWLDTSDQALEACGFKATGCYDLRNNVIYILNNSQDENPFYKFTFLHELMHVAYIKDVYPEINHHLKIKNLIDQAKANAHTQNLLNALIKPYLELKEYKNSTTQQEMLLLEEHAYIATYVYDIPDELEKHYAEYILNRQQFILQELENIEGVKMSPSKFKDLIFGIFTNQAEKVSI